MIACRRLLSITQHFRLQLSQRSYARKTVTTTDANMKQVHQQTLRYVRPNALIKIDSDIYVKVSTADPHMYPDGDAFIAGLHGGPVKNCTASMVIKVSDDESNVEVILRKLAEPTDFHCELAVPVRAAIDINSRHAAAVKNTYGDVLKVKAEQFINIKDVRSEKIELLSSEGDISCQGLLLGKSTTVETQNKGNIILDKLQGDEIKCRTTQGNITTNCSYVESAEFQTDTGSLDLKNIHKKAKVSIHQKGDLKMTGVHGNLKVSMNEGTMNLQLSKLHGENTIEANNLTSCLINISENMEKGTNIDVSLIGDANASTINLDNTLKHLSLALEQNKQNFRLNQEQENKLKVTSKSSLTLGKSSWSDMMRLQIAEKQEKIL